MTNEELDALVDTLAFKGEVRGGTDRKLMYAARDAITTLRAQLAEARAERDQLQRLANGQEEQLEIQGNMLIRLNSRCIEQSARADRADAALAAQIEADAGIADDYVKMRERQIADEKAKAAHHVDVPQLMRWGAGKVQSEIIAAAIRNQPHDRTVLDAMLREKREKALREAADRVKALAPESRTPQGDYDHGWNRCAAVSQDAILAMIPSADRAKGASDAP